MSAARQSPTSASEAWGIPDESRLASYATHSSRSAGRKHAESPPAHRDPYQLDCDRIIRSAACRRLSAKTQVFTCREGDYHRTRLTHTLEVVSLARTVGRALRLNEDLIEALALAHDLGHPPFGHAGEVVLDECLTQHGGFCHNRHALVIVEELESCRPEFPGLNLTREVLAGQAKRAKGAAEKNAGASLEVQVVDAADSVTYDAHDADDAVELRLIELGELIEQPLVAEACHRVKNRYHALSPAELKRATLQDMIAWQTDDLLAASSERLAGLPPETTSESFGSQCLIEASAAITQQKAALETFLFNRVYRHPLVLAERARVQNYLRQLFGWYLEQSEWLPHRFKARSETVGMHRAVGEYLAGMTDRFAEHQYVELVAASRLG